MSPSGGPPRMTLTRPPLTERREAFTASQPEGRCAGRRSGGWQEMTRAARTSATSTARSASPR